MKIQSLVSKQKLLESFSFNSIIKIKISSTFSGNGINFISSKFMGKPEYTVYDI